VLARVAAPTGRATAADVTAVGLKDVPLRSLYPNEPKPPAPGAPKMKVAIIGGGLSGLSTAVELLDQVRSPPASRHRSRPLHSGTCRNPPRRRRPRRDRGGTRGPQPAPPAPTPPPRHTRPPQGHEVEIFEARPFMGGKVGSFVDKDGNHIEIGLHVFFGCYFNLFRLMAKCGVLENLLVKDHTHTFCNKGGDVRELDFRFEVNDTKVGAPFHGINAFLTTPQLEPIDKLGNSIALATSPIVRSLIDPEGGMKDIRALDGISFSEWFLAKGGTRESINRMWDPIAYALGFLDCDEISARCMLTIFQFFATKTDASVLRMLNGSPAERLLKPIIEYIEAKGGKINVRWGCREVLYEEGPDGHPVVTGLRMGKASEEKIVTADAYVAALDVPGAKKLLPQKWREYPQFNNIWNLKGVPVITVQLRYDGWVTELNDAAKRKETGSRDAVPGAGINNLLYSGDADYSCFADLALTSPEEYYKEGEGSLLQCVITPASPYFPLSNEEIAQKIHEQTMNLFPSARDLTLKWHSVVKIGQSLYEERPGYDVYRPDQRTPVPNFYLAGSYTKQDYIDSMEGATLSGRQCAYAMVEDAPKILASQPKAAKTPATATATA